jgi:predicted AAA+ superfamily ATPase
LPLDDLTVRNELVKYLPAGWDPIVDRDIDGSQAEPRRIDDDTPSLGSLQACRRSARTMFLGSAPSVSEQKVRGIGIERVRLGCALPGQSVTKYDDALRRLTDRLHYLYTGNERYWFDLRTNLRREMEDRMQRYDERADLYPEIKERLERVVKSSLFSGIHVFTDGKDVPDKIAGDLRLVVLSPAHGHRRKDGASKATQAAQQILTRHGDRQREYQNRLLFLAPDSNAAQTLLEQVRRHLAWQSIVEEADALNLDKHNEKEANKNCDEAAKRVEASIRETYRFLLAPMQEPDTASGPAKIVWEDETLALAGSTYERVLDSVTKEREWIIRMWAPAHLRALLSKWFWKDERPSASTSKVWHDTCRYLYMPRLSSSEVFLETVRDGLLSTEWFGYAAAEPTPGAYQGLVLGRLGTAYLDETSVLIHPAAAEKALPKPADPAAEPPPNIEHLPPPLRLTEQRPGGRSGSSPAPAAHVPQRRFHGTTNIDPGDPIASFTEIVQNVIEHFTAQYGTEVTISLDIEARRPRDSGGFDPKTIRIARENATTLKFKTAEFEEE